MVGFSCKRIVCWLERKKWKEELEFSYMVQLCWWWWQVQAYHNFVPLMITLSINYMDWFMSHHHLLIWENMFYALSCGLFYMWQSRECTHVFVPICFVCQQMCMEFLCCNLIFLQQGKVWILQLLSITYMFLVTKMEKTKVPIFLWLASWISYHLVGLLWKVNYFFEQITM